MTPRPALVAAMVLVMGACVPQAPEAEPFLGVWASDGWGILLHVHGVRADVYEVTGERCRLADSGGARGIDEVVALDGDHLVLTDAGRVIRFDPLPDLPAECSAPSDPSAGQVLATAVAAVEEHYHPGVDDGWEVRVADLVADDTTLLAALQVLLRPLADPQVVLDTGDGEVWSASRPEAAAALAGALRDGALLPGATFTAGDGLVLDDLGDGIRYLGVLRLGGLAGSDEGSQRMLAAALDASLRDASALILDLRPASGGSDVEALLVATRFVVGRTVVATIAAHRADGGTVPAGAHVVHPMPAGPFPGRVVVLIGPGTAGPAEVLALALDPLPGVVLVGEPTAGSPSSPLVRTLPNGWVLGVPNLDVVTPDGVSRVGAPLLPDVVAPLTAGDVAAGRDPGLDAARAALAG